MRALPVTGKKERKEKKRKRNFLQHIHFGTTNVHLRKTQNQCWHLPQNADLGPRQDASYRIIHRKRSFSSWNEPVGESAFVLTFQSSSVEESDFWGSPSRAGGDPGEEGEGGLWSGGIFIGSVVRSGGSSEEIYLKTECPRRQRKT